MSNADARSEQASRAARERWGNQVAVRSAETVIERAGELPAEIRAAVHEVTAPAGGEVPADGDR